MRFLLTNDDGIEAAGLAALAVAAAPLGELTWIAPTVCHSSCGHRVTADRPISIIDHRERRWVLDGTPADCIRVGLGNLFPDADYVLSGINHGGNLGADIYYSGTVAAVREAALHGKPGIAVSHYRKRGREFDWDRAARWLRPVLVELLQQPLEPGAFWNVNLPDPDPGQPEPGMVFCPLERGPLPLAYRVEGDEFHYAGNYHERRREAGTDVDVCFRGNIAVTKLQV